MVSKEATYHTANPCTIILTSDSIKQNYELKCSVGCVVVVRVVDMVGIRSSLLYVCHKGVDLGST